MRALGIDVGTTTVSVLLLDAASGEVLQSRCFPNDSALRGGAAYERLQDAEKLWGRVSDAVGEPTLACGPCASVGVTGQMHGVLYVDASGNPVSPLYSWQDASADQDMGNGVTYARKLSELTGYPMASGFGLSTLYVHTLAGKVPDSAAKLCTIGDFIAMRLAGETAPMMTPSNAASVGLFRLGENCFDEDAAARAGLPGRLLPRVQAGFGIVGHTRRGEPVAAAIGDNQASVLGSVGELEDAVLVNVGTGSQVSVGVPAGGRTPGEGIERRPCLPGTDILVGAPLCGGRAYALLEEFFQQAAELAGVRADHALYAQMAAAAMASEEEPMLVLPLFSGTRQNPSERAVISNIGVENFTPAALIKGMLRGMAGELYGLYEKMLPAKGRPPRLLVGSGNGIRKNAGLVKALEDAFGLPMRVPAHEEEAAFGAALYGLVSAGLFPSMREAQSLIRYRGESEHGGKTHAQLL